MAKPKIYSRVDFDYFETVESTKGDMDDLGHINHISYLNYMLTARTNYRESLGIETNKRDGAISFIVASIKIDYVCQAEHPAIFDVGERICKVGKTSFQTLTAVFLSGAPTPLVQARYTMVAYNFLRKTTVPLPEKIIKACRCL